MRGDDRDVDIDLDVAPRSGQVADRPPNVRSALLRPWPRPVLVAVTALCTAGLVAVGLDRADSPGRGAEQMVTVLPESWLVEGTAEPDDVPRAFDEELAAADEAAEDVPDVLGDDSYDVVEVTGNDFEGELIGLAPGSYDFHVTCRIDRAVANTGARFTIDGSDLESTLEQQFHCEPGEVASWQGIEFDDYTALSVSGGASIDDAVFLDEEYYMGFALFIVER